eukprot:TRINITY_DN3345_c0_g1_i16.p1 TRINITY_DN3345_c0_g1~~TRINITY_DN3345_c0_g1_i16.p1  ORF type:complete len:198 (+),score=25.61 TRINITY_DN3345_c0_g1_i16:18-611(+)
MQCFFFSSRRRHTRQESVSWARRCVQETGLNEEIYSSKDQDKKINSFKNEAFIDFFIKNKMVKGDICFQFFNNALMKSKEPMFHFWINTAFFDDEGRIFIEKNMLDRACKDKKHKKFSKNFSIEVHCYLLDQSTRHSLQYTIFIYRIYLYVCVLAHLSGCIACVHSSHRTTMMFPSFTARLPSMMSIMVLVSLFSAS